MSFKRFDQEDIAISAESVVAPAWTGQVSKLTTAYTGSQAVTPSGKYYNNIYQADYLTTGSEVQYSIAYGNINGSGSALFASTEVGKSPSSVIYGQYRTLINGDENTNFTFGTRTPNSIYVISVNRARYKEKLLPGSFELTLTSGSKTITLIDNSKDLTTLSYVDAGRVYDIVSGSIATGTSLTPEQFTITSGSYGKFLPDVGVVVLNGDALKDSQHGIQLLVSESYNTEAGNKATFFNAIKSGANFTLRSEETITSNYVFVRVRNSEFNYSTNPSNITGSGELLHTVMVNTPQAYMTTVGLYNDNNDLLGVAKLSAPLLKDFTKEALVRIKLDY
jgi:hypothetical protein